MRFWVASAGHSTTVHLYSMRRKRQKTEGISALPPEVRRRRLPASSAILMMQEGAAQMRNDANRDLCAAHYARTKLPSTKALREAAKQSPAATALGRAKQAQYAIDDALATFGSFRRNFFDWVKDQASRPGKPRPPRFYRRGQRVRIRVDYQDLRIAANCLYLPKSFGLPAIPLVERGAPLLAPGDRVVEVRVEPCRSRQYLHADLVIRRAKAVPLPIPRAGRLLVDLGVSRLATCLDEAQVQAFFVDGALAKSILARGAKWHAKLQSETDRGLRHGKARAGALAARSARQIEDLMKKVARLIVAYATAQQLGHVVVGRNKDWKQRVDLGRKANQLFTFIPHGKLIQAIKSQCARASIEFSETEESYTSKTDHLATEPMGKKSQDYRWLGSRSPRGLFRSSVGTVLQADVNGCIGIGRKVGGEQWLSDFIQRLGASPGTRLVPRNVYVNGAAPVLSPGAEIRHPRLLSPRAWISTKVALAKAGLVPDLQRVAPRITPPRRFPMRPNRVGLSLDYATKPTSQRIVPVRPALN